MRPLFLLHLLTLHLVANPDTPPPITINQGQAVIEITTDTTITQVNLITASLRDLGIPEFALQLETKDTPTWLTPTWLLEENIRLISPESQFRKMDEIQALATLKGIDVQLAKQRELFEQSRSALVSFVYKNGVPDYAPDASLTHYKKEKSTHLETLNQLINADSKEQLLLAASIQIPGNPIPQHLSNIQSSETKLAALFEQGYGKSHPDCKAAQKLIDTHQKLAEFDITYVEEALRIRLYQLTTRITHFKTWKTLTPAEQKKLSQTYQSANQRYNDDLETLRQTQTAKIIANLR